MPSGVGGDRGLREVRVPGEGFKQDVILNSEWKKQGATLTVRESVPG